MVKKDQDYVHVVIEFPLTLIEKHDFGCLAKCSLKFADTFLTGIVLIRKWQKIPNYLAQSIQNCVTEIK